MCNVWKQKDSKEMTLDEIKIAAHKLKRLGLTNVVITGGEPTLRTDLPEIISIFSKLGISTRLQTNGMLLDEEKLDKLVESGLDDLTISLDTLDNKKQAEICGINKKDLSDTFAEKLKLSVKKMPHSMVVANLVVSHKNIDELTNLIKYTSSFGAWPTFCPVSISEDNEGIFKAKADAFKFNQEDKIKANKIYREVIKLKKQGYKVSLSNKYLRDSLKYIKTGKKKWKCDAGEYYLVILPEGQLAICDDITTDLNILDSNFFERFNSKDFKKKIKEKRKNCDGCIYGIFRENSYIINHPSVLFDRFLTFLRTHYHGKSSNS